jgi:hypothetical protein
MIRAELSKTKISGNVTIRLKGEITENRGLDKIVCKVESANSISWYLGRDCDEDRNASEVYPVRFFITV